MGSTWSYLDLTALGRQEEWEDSPRVTPDPPLRMVDLATTNQTDKITSDPAWCNSAPPGQRAAKRSSASTALVKQTGISNKTGESHETLPLRRISHGAQPRHGKALVAEALKTGRERVYAGKPQRTTTYDKRVTPMTLDVTKSSQIQAGGNKVGNISAHSTCPASLSKDD